MNISTTYKGRLIEIEVFEVRNGWSWSYTIDGSDFTERTDRPLPTASLAEMEAMQDMHAKLRKATE